MIEVGTLIKAKTKTKDDTFGEVIWKVIEVGLKAPETGRETIMDGVKCSMLGGSGPSARSGYTVIDSEWHILDEVKKGVAEFVLFDKVSGILAYYAKQGSKPKAPSGALGIEM